jgi:hypothetical protein
MGFNVKEELILLSEHIYGFCKTLRIRNVYFLKQQGIDCVSCNVVTYHLKF